MQAKATRGSSGWTRREILAPACSLCACLALSPFAVSGSPAQASADLEYRVKAAFLFNFVRYVVWPENRAESAESYVIGILGKDPFGSALHETIRGKRVRGRGLALRHVTDLTEAPGCNLLFISASERRNLRRILTRLQGESVLTVSEVDSFLDRGGMLNFVIEKDQVRFEINLDAAREAGLDVSSQLLRVARDVRFERR